MQKIYHSAIRVLIWLGPDTEDHQAKVAVESILTVSDFICQKLDISIADLRSIDNVYEFVAKNLDRLPLPNKCDFSTDTLWNSLVWFYSRPYFGRVWVIPEVNLNKERLLHCGHEIVIYDRVSLVARYITMESAFSKSFSFTNTYC